MDMKKSFGFIVGTAFMASCFFVNGAFLKANASAYVHSGIENEAKVITVSNESKTDLSLPVKAAYMMDSASKTQIYAERETERLPIASMCKIMTLVLCFDEINRGNLAMDQSITVSDRAASMGGSQVFLEAGGTYSVGELMKSIVVCSANDSCVALAEHIAGSEALFVGKMNEKAKELGAENTLFANCTGLPKDPQYSCAKDVAYFLTELVKNEEYFAFSRIWTDRFMHPKGRYTDITNTNRMVRFYEGCDGGKTGFTNQAGFCLAATAKRGEMRIVSVVIGAETSDRRFGAVRTMFDYAFGNYALKTVLDENNPLNEQVCVRNGKADFVQVKAERGSYIFSKRDDAEEISLDVRLKKSIKAPVREGDDVGEAVVYKNSVEIDRVKLVAAESVACAGFKERFKKVVGFWNI